MQLCGLPTMSDETSGASEYSTMPLNGPSAAALKAALTSATVAVVLSTATRSWEARNGPVARLSRLSSLSDTSGTLESYDYLGLGTVVRRGHSQPGIDLTYIKQTGESSGDAGDQYTGLDRFGRVVDQRWLYIGSMNMDRRSAH